MPNNCWRDPAKYRSYFALEAAPAAPEIMCNAADGGRENLHEFLYRQFCGDVYSVEDGDVILSEELRVILLQQNQPSVGKRRCPDQPIQDTAMLEAVVATIQQRLTSSNQSLRFAGHGLSVNESRSLKTRCISLKADSKTQRQIGFLYNGLVDDLYPLGVTDTYDRIGLMHMGLVDVSYDGYKDFKGPRQAFSSVANRFGSLRTLPVGLRVVLRERLFSCEGHEVGQRTIAQFSQSGDVIWVCRDPFSVEARDAVLNKSGVSLGRVCRNGSRNVGTTFRTA